MDKTNPEIEEMIEDQLRQSAEHLQTAMYMWGEYRRGQLKGEKMKHLKRRIQSIRHDLLEFDIDIEEAGLSVDITDLRRCWNLYDRELEKFQEALNSIVVKT